MKRVLAVLLVTAAAGCSFDLALPEQPQRGRLVGKIDTRGHIPLEGQSLNASGEHGERAMTVTEADGSFIFADLAPGLYLVSFKLPGFAKLTSELLRVTAGQDTDVGTLTPDWLESGAQAARLKGFVGLKDDMGAVIKGDVNGSKVEFLLNGSAPNQKIVVNQQIVSGDGQYALTLPPGTYDIKASNPLYATQTLTAITLPEGSEVDLISTNQPVLMGVQPAYLEGTIMEEVDGANPQPSEGAVVSLVETGENGHTDVAGHFKLTGVIAGPYNVRVQKPGKFHDTVPFRPVTLVPLQTTTLSGIPDGGSADSGIDLIILQLDRGNISGTVSTGTTPVAGARVEVAGTGYIALVAPDPTDATKGTFLIDGVPVKDDWTVIARKDQFSNASATANVTVGKTTNVGTLTLARLLGDFLIDDADTTNTPGYTHTLEVTLNFAGFPPTGITGYRASEDPTFASFDGGFLPYSGKLQPFTLAAGEGLHTVFAQYDINGQSSQAFSSTIFLDTLAPDVPTVAFDSTGTAGSTRYTNHSQNLTLQVLSSDNAGSGVALMKVGDTLVGPNVAGPTEPYKLNAVLTRSIVVDGPQNGYVQVIDFAGNVSAPGSDAVIVDTVAPTGSIALANGPKATDPGYTNTTLVTVNETWNDAVTVDGGTSVVLIKLANTSADLNAAVYQPTSPSSGWFIDPIGEVPKTVWAKFRDAAGNETMTAASATITYDITPPTPASIAIVGATTTNNPAVVVSMTTNPADLSSNQAFTLSDESTFTSSGKVGPSAFPAMSQSPFTFSAGDGVRTLYARFRDKAGNDAITSTQLTLDTVVPTGSFTLTGTLADGSLSSTVTSSNQVTVNLSAGGATEYRLGDATMTTCPASGYTPITTAALTNQTLPAGGVMTLCLRDAAKNTQGPLSQTLGLDTSAPAGCAFTLAGKKLDGSAAPAGLTALANLTATMGSCTETPTEYFFSTSPVTCANNLAWVQYSANTAVTFASGDGVKNIYGCVRDSARNFASVSSGAITLDTSGPSPTTATLATAVLTNGASSTLNISAADPSGLGTTDAVTASEDPFFSATGTVGPIAFPGSNQVTVNLSAGDGAKTIYVRFRDRLQNSTVANVQVTRDATAPSGTVTVEGNLADGTPSQTEAAPYLSSPPTVKVYLSAGSGANQYAFVPTAATSCALATYAALSGTTLSTTLLVAGAVGSVQLCLKDAAGNTTATPLTDTIPYYATAPSGCTLALAGLMADGVTAAPAGQSAKPVITATVSGCSATAVEYYLSNGTVTCSAFTSASYVTYNGPSTAGPFLLSGEGTNTVSGCVRDIAGNVASLAPQAMNLDTTPPSALGLSIHSDAPYFNASQLTSGQRVVSVAGSATGATQWAISENTPISSFASFTGAPVNFTFPADGNPRVLYAQFRDALGNLSTVVSDSITVDTAAPDTTGIVLTLVSPTSNTYVNSVSATVTTANVPADADTVQLAEDLVLPTPGCTAADFAGATTSPVASSYSFVLNATNGAKNICARWYDAAGNVSGIVNDASKTLDTVAPLTPAVITNERTFNPLAGDQSLAQLVVFTNTPDINHATWQVLGGVTTSWTTIDAGTQLAPIPLTAPFTLRTDHTLARGLPNILQIRETDLAGNASEAAQLTMTTDIVPPQPVTMNTLWVDNASTTALIRWQKSASPDIAGYYVYYSASPAEPGGLPDAGSVWADGGNLYADGGYIIPNGYNGFYAAEGSSPVLVGDQNYVALNSLPNGSPTYVTVRAVDHAGNIGLQPTAPAREVQMQPNEVSPNLLFDVPVLRDAGYVGNLSGTQVAIAGDYAYVMAGTNVNFSCPGTGSTVIQPFDLSTVVSPMHGGAIIPNPPGPVSYPPVLVNDEQCAGFPGAIQAEYPFLFTVAGRHFRVWSIANPKVPTPLVDLVVGGSNAHLNALDVRGNNALVAGNGFAYHIDVSSLYDNNQATRTLTIVGSQSLFALNPFSGAITWTRNKAVVGNSSSGVQNNTLNLTSMVDGDNLTTFGSGLPTTSVSTTQPFISQMHGNGFTSGNYAVTGEIDGIHVYDQTKIFSNTAPYWDPFTVIPFPGWGQLDVVGHQAFFGEYPTGGIVSVDLSDLANIHFSGITRAAPAPAFAPRPSGFATYGNYAVQVTDASNGAPNLRMYELASPRGLRSVMSFDMYSQSALHVTPGFVTSATGMMVDLWGGLTPNLSMITTAGSFCAYGGAIFDDTLVSSVDVGGNNGYLRLTALDNAIARPAIPVDVTSNSAALIAPLPATSYARGLARVGNYLLVATARNTAPSSLVLEAYRASGLRSRMPVGSAGSARTLVAGAAPGTGDKVSEYSFATSGIGASVLMPMVRVTNNMAVVNGDGHVWVIDIAPMLDDTTLTTMGASSIQADLTGLFPQDAMLSGNRLYVLGTPPGGSPGLLIYDATPALDGNSLTTLGPANLISSTPILSAAALEVRGSYALVASYNNINGGVTALDVRNAAQPRVISYLPKPIGNISLGCTSTHPAITFQGSRAYVGYKERFDILELE